jgi:hypothetical protein
MRPAMGKYPVSQCRRRSLPDNPIPNADNLRRELGLSELSPFADGCSALGVSTRTGHRLRRVGALVTVKVGGKRYIDIRATRAKLLGAGR